jgi:hypothetical protein
MATAIPLGGVNRMGDSQAVAPLGREEPFLLSRSAGHSIPILRCATAFARTSPIVRTP